MTDFEILFGYERELWDEAVRLDKGRLDALLADDFEEFAANGVSYNKKTIIDALSQQVFSQTVVHDFKAQYLASDVVLLTYIATHADQSKSLRSAIWRKNGDRWQMIFHQATKVL